MHRELVIGHAEALRAVDTIRAELARREKTGVIAVADAHGELIALARLDGAPLSSIAVATNKAFTAARLRRSTREHGARIRERGVDIAFYGDPRYVGFGGGLRRAARAGRRDRDRRGRGERPVRRRGRSAGGARRRRHRRRRVPPGRVRRR